MSDDKKPRPPRFVKDPAKTYEENENARRESLGLDPLKPQRERGNFINEDTLRTGAMVAGGALALGTVIGVAAAGRQMIGGHADRIQEADQPQVRTISREEQRQNRPMAIDNPPPRAEEPPRAGGPAEKGTEKSDERALERIKGRDERNRRDSGPER